MPFEDFAMKFQRVKICQFGPDSIPDDNSKKNFTPVKWEMASIDGSWKRNINAGEFANFKC